MSLILVVARVPRRDGSASETIAAGPDRARGPVATGRLATLASAVAADAEDPTIAYAASVDDAVEAVQRQAADGAGTVVVVPIEAVRGAAAPARSPGSPDLRDRLDAVGRRHPSVDIQYLGPPFVGPQALETAVAALRPADSSEPKLIAEAVERAFGGDLDRFARFMTALQAGVPPGTQIVLRGSAVQGLSFKTGEPFDAAGPGTSDLDVVLLGEAAMAEWAPTAFYLPGINSLPLGDDAPGVASESVRRAQAAAQAAAGRPVAIQAMARWFLDLRSALQATPYVVLTG